MSPPHQDDLVGVSPSDLPDDTEPVLVFGRYRFFPRQRRLFAGETPVELGSRALEILVALIEADGELVTTDALRKRVWPTTIVEDHNVQVQVSMLRRALGEDRELIRNEAGRGYRLAATVRLIPSRSALRTNVLAPLSALIGREDDVAELEELVAAHRLVTLTGAGGIGKTRLGLAVARAVLRSFPDGVWLVELGSLTDPEFVPGAVARALGVELGAGRDALDQLVAILHRRHLLLLLDNCEHVIDAVAVAAEKLLHGAPRLHILTTSQELLAAEGERVYRVSPLKVPVGDGENAAKATAYSAVQLFIERAQAADPSFVLNDETAAAASRICRHLDGIPLAIELAAACVPTIGAEMLAKRLDDRFRLLTGGRRTALKRHQTLSAALDWSYGLLGAAERRVLGRLAVFAGSFTLDGGATIAASGDIGKDEASETISRLVRKSLVALDGMAQRYRLLDTTRAYAFAKLVESGELESVAHRHASYYRDLLERAQATLQTTPAAELVARYAPEIDNIRLALNWAFEQTGEAEIGVALAAASAPLWILMSMLSDCRDLVRRALSELDKVSADRKRHEMRLQAALGISSMWAEGSVSATLEASTRAFQLAAELGDIEHQLRALFILWTYPLRRGEYRDSLAVARRFKQVAQSGSDILGELTAVRMEGVALFHVGEFAGARTAMERILADPSPDLRRSFAVRFGIDQRVAALVYLIRVLWIEGLVDQAASRAKAALEEARDVNNANALCMVLCDNLCATAALSGDYESVEAFSTTLADCGEKHGLGMWQALATAFKGVSAVGRGDSALGLRLLRSAFDGSRGTRIDLRNTIFVEAFTDALATAGRVGDGLAVLQRILDDSLSNDGHWFVPELLRLRGRLRLRENLATAPAAAEKDFAEAVALASRLGALSWELRAAVSLARLRLEQGRNDEARAVLLPVHQKFSEGFATLDLKTAAALIEELR